MIKKNVQVWVCTDFRDLNLVTPKDEYVMPIADMLVDVVAKHGFLTFMDGHFGYNQIFMAEDVHKITFCCPSALGIYEWLIMSFGLENARPTYQRDMILIFHYAIGKNMEVYIDDEVVNSTNMSQHLADLE